MTSHSEATRSAFVDRTLKKWSLSLSFTSLCLMDVTGTSLLTLTLLSGFSMMFMYISSTDLVILIGNNVELEESQKQESSKNYVN